MRQKGGGGRSGRVCRLMLHNNKKKYKHRRRCIVELNTFLVAEHPFSSPSLRREKFLRQAQSEKGRKASDAHGPPVSWYLTCLYWALYKRHKGLHLCRMCAQMFVFKPTRDRYSSCKIRKYNNKCIWFNEETQFKWFQGELLCKQQREKRVCYSFGINNSYGAFKNEYMYKMHKWPNPLYSKVAREPPAPFIKCLFNSLFTSRKWEQRGRSSWGGKLLLCWVVDWIDGIYFLIDCLGNMLFLIINNSVSGLILRQIGCSFKKSG